MDNQKCSESFGGWLAFRYDVVFPHVLGADGSNQLGDHLAINAPEKTRQKDSSRASPVARRS
jgi:hypothetical protein